MEYMVYRRLYATDRKIDLTIQLFESLRRQITIPKIQKLFRLRIQQLEKIRFEVAEHLYTLPLTIKHMVIYRQRPIHWYRKESMRTLCGTSHFFTALKSGDSKMIHDLEVLGMNLPSSRTYLNIKKHIQQIKEHHFKI